MAAAVSVRGGWGWGDSEDLYCWGPGWEVVPQFQHTIHHQQRHSYAEFYNPFSFFSSLSLSPLSHSPYFTTTYKSFHPLKYYTLWPVRILTLCVNDWNIRTSRIITWNDRVTAQSTWCPSRDMNAGTHQKKATSTSAVHSTASSRSTSATKALSFTRDKVQIQNFACHETFRCPHYTGCQLLALRNCEQIPGQDCNVTTIWNVIYHLTVTARFSQTGVVWRTSVLHYQCDCTAWWITFKNLRYRLKNNKAGLCWVAPPNTRYNFSFLVCKDHLHKPAY